MKKILMLALIVLAACGPTVAVTNIDPCDPATYNEPMCQQAITQQGFYNSQHIFVHHVYSQPLFYYHGGYNSYIVRRRTVVVSPRTTVVVPQSRTYVRPVPRPYYRYRSR